MRFTSQRCYTLALMVWEWAIASLPIDVVLWLHRPIQQFRGDDSNPALYILIAIALGGVFRESLLETVAATRRIRSRFTERQMLLALIIVGLLGAADILVRLIANAKHAPFALIAGIVVFVLWKSWRSAGQIKQHREKFFKDRMAQVEQANLLHLAIVVFPIIASRAVSLMFAMNSGDQSTFILGMVVAIALLLALRPLTENFMAACPRCQRMTSRAVIVEGCCPYCAPEKFSVELVQSGATGTAGKL